MEKLRRGLHSLEGNSELRNLISEEDDVQRAYENIVKQKDEAVKFFNKWGTKETDKIKSIIATVQDVNQSHSITYKEFARNYRFYINSLKDVLARREKLDVLEKKIKDLEQKHAKKKGGDDSELTNAKAERDRMINELDKFSEDSLREGLTNLSKAYIELYTTGINLMNKQLAALGASPVTPVGAVPASAIAPGPHSGTPAPGAPTATPVSASGAPPGYAPQGQGVVPAPSQYSGAPSQYSGQYPPLHGAPPGSYPPQQQPPHQQPANPHSPPPPAYGGAPPQQGAPSSGSGAPPPGYAPQGQPHGQYPPQYGAPGQQNPPSSYGSPAPQHGAPPGYAPGPSDPHAQQAPGYPNYPPQQQQQQQPGGAPPPGYNPHQQQQQQPGGAAPGYDQFPPGYAPQQGGAPAYHP